MKEDFSVGEWKFCLEYRFLSEDNILMCDLIVWRPSLGGPFDPHFNVSVFECRPSAETEDLYIITPSNVKTSIEAVVNNARIRNARWTDIIVLDSGEYKILPSIVEKTVDLIQERFSEWIADIASNIWELASRSIEFHVK